jgi:hypothetical protein
MPGQVQKTKIEKGETRSGSVPCGEWVLTALQADKPVQLRVLGGIEDDDEPVLLSIQPGPPEVNPVNFMLGGIALFSVAYPQGVAFMLFEATEPVSETVNIKARFRSFPND